MTRTNEVTVEQKQERRVLAAGAAVVYQLEGYLGHGGIQLKGMSLRTNELESLMILRADIGGAPCVAFIGSGDISGCFIKAVKQAKDGTINWVNDKYAD